VTQHDGSEARSTPGRLEYERAIRRSDLPWQSRHLALTIATWADLETGIIPDQDTPTLSTLEESTGLSHDAVLKYLKVLEAGGWLKQSERTRYHLAVPGGRGEAGS